MTQGATHGGAREECTLRARARAIAGDAIPEGERFWASHVGSASAAAMFVPALTVLVLMCHSKGPSRPGAAVLRRESEAAKIPALQRPASCSLRGRILDMRGEPAAHASVRAVSVRADGGPHAPGASVAVADFDGRFCLRASGMRRARVIAENDDDGFVESAELDVESPHELVLVLEHAPRVRGIVLDERGASVPNAIVKSWGGSEASEKIVTADDDGRYVIERVAPGAHRVTAWRRGFAAATVDASRESSVVTLLPTRIIRGTVTGPSGRPVAGARVIACEGSAKEAAISDAAGRFELPGTTDGCAAIASHPQFCSARPVTIDAQSDLVVRLAAGGAIEGVLVDGRGAPVNSFSVAIESFAPADGESEDASRAGETRDELRGSFRFDGLPAGSYVVHAGTNEGATSQSRTIEVARGKVVHGVRLVLGATEVSSSTEETSSSENVASD